MPQNRLIHYLLRYKWRYLPGFVALLGASVLVMLPPIVIREAVDSITRGTTMTRLAALGGVMLGLAVAESGLRFAARHLVSGTSRLVEYDLRSVLAAHLMRLDQRFYLKSQTGDLMARGTNDLERVRMLAGAGLIDLIRLPVMMLVGLLLMLTIDVRLALISIAYFPVIIVIIILVQTTTEAKYRAVQDQFGVLTSRVQENISGVRVIKAYAQEEAELATFAAANQEMIRRTMAWAYYAAGFWPVMVLATGSSIVLVLWFGGREVVAGQLTVGQFVQFIAYLAILAGPVLSLSWTVMLVQQGLASWKRVREVLSSEPQIVEPRQPVPRIASGGDIEFRSVTFGYNDRPVLRNVNLRIPAGATAALVGETGSGKTTLVNLLVRLFDPWEGQVTLGGVDVRQFSLEELREAVGFVSQESFLFSDPLRENLSYGRSNPPHEELEQVIETSQLVNDLPQFTHGLDTLIGERGMTLSGGQKQRVALARALLKRPQILVLDDALAHVDTYTEEQILQRLQASKGQRTTILIAHRTSTVASADLIVTLEDGAIAEIGTHEDLLGRDGVYSRFYRRQLVAEQLQEETQVVPPEDQEISS